MKCFTPSLLLFLVLLSVSPAETVPEEARQLVVSIADHWDSSRAELRCFQRGSASAPWQPVLFAQPVPVLLGKNGLAWGRGVLPNPPITAATKREGDRRAPAGCFRIGKVLGYPKTLPKGANYHYHQVTARDAWIDDPKNPLYNQHYVLQDPSKPPAWFAKQRMRLGDAAYHYLIEIHHNTAPIEPGAGSAIFFHTRRGVNRFTSGCTTMARTDLEKLITWLRVDAQPHYVLLPKNAYHGLTSVWQLPQIAATP